MLAIRLFRTGKKNQPFFKIVVTEKKNAPHGGRFVESLGFVNPLTKENKVNAERVKYWLSVGAKPSDTIYNLLIKKGVIEGKKIPLHNVKPVKEEEKKEEVTVKKEETSAEDNTEEKTEEVEAVSEEEEKKEEKVEEVIKEEAPKEEAKSSSESIEDASKDELGTSKKTDREEKETTLFDFYF